MRRIIGAAALVATVATGCAENNSTTKAEPAETVEIAMTDNAYEPSSITVQRGQKVLLRFTNEGSLEHEAILGDDAAQESHAASMKDGMSASGEDGMHHGDDDRVVSVKAGQTGEITTTFEMAGTLFIGCHKPGHYESGMKATLTIT